MSGSKQDGGPAFPPMHSPDNHPSGMSLRDYFAGQALTGLIPKVPFVAGTPDDIHEHIRRTVSGAYHYADAMLAERSKP